MRHRSADEVRIWLEQRPAVQKAVLLEGLSRCPDDDDFERYAGIRFRPDCITATLLPTSDLGAWIRSC